jgi:hypothetical protein
MEADCGARRKHNGDLWQSKAGAHGGCVSDVHGVKRSYGALTPHGGGTRLVRYPNALSTRFGESAGFKLKWARVVCRDQNFHVYSLVNTAGSKRPEGGARKLWHVVARARSTQVHSPPLPAAGARTEHDLMRPLRPVSLRSLCGGGRAGLQMAPTVQHVVDLTWSVCGEMWSVGIGVRAYRSISQDGGRRSRGSHHGSQRS